MTRSSLLLSLLLCLAGCAEVRPTDAGTDAPVQNDTPMTMTDAPMTMTDTPMTMTDTPSTDAPAAGNVVVINEINPASPDWVELINAGTTALSLDGLSIVDDDDTHVPVAFPTGTMLAPGARFIVAFDVPCADAPPAGLGLTESCIQTTYGIGGGGDTIRILRGTAVTDPVEVMEVFAGGLATGQTYCRLPDATGAFGPCTPTPNATNAEL
jgi:hypothetical protein